MEVFNFCLLFSCCFYVSIIEDIISCLELNGIILMSVDLIRNLSKGATLIHIFTKT